MSSDAVEASLGAVSAAPRLIALTAYARAGKDSVADILVREEGYERVAFADPIRTVILGMNPLVKVAPKAGWNYRVRPHRRLGELVAEHGWDWIKDYSPEGRRLLNTLGAEIRKFDNEFWVNATMNSLDPNKRYVIADCRFPGEVDAVRAQGGVLVRITRPGINAARDPLTGQPYLSEVALDKVDVDYVLNNDGPSLDYLAKETLRMLRRIPAILAEQAA